MADGYVRDSGRPGVALVILGPGVTNTFTAIGQAYADSVPGLMLSADGASHTLGKGRGCLHEVSCLTDTTDSNTGFNYDPQVFYTYAEIMGGKESFRMDAIQGIQ